MIALSWSRLNTFMQCPLKFHLTFISKSFPAEQESIHLIKGQQLHKQMEEYIIAKNGGGTMPLGFSPEVKDTIPYADKLFNLYQSVHPEAQIACDIDWKPAEWFGKNVAWRAIWDVVGLSTLTCFIGDWKSGKIYPYGEGYGQLHLSSAIAMNRFVDVPEVTSAYIYMEHKKITPIRVTRQPTNEIGADGKPVAHLQAVMEYFNSKFEEVQKETKWDPKPNPNCQWCAATKAQCKFSRKL